MTTERFGIDARVAHAGGCGDMRHFCGTVIAVEDDKRRVRLDDGDIVTWEVEHLRSTGPASKGSDADAIIRVLNEFDLEANAHKSYPGGTWAEYKPEAIILLQRVVEQPLTAQFVRDVWLVMFATHDVLVRTRGMNGRHGQERRVEIGDMPMRPEFQEIADKVNRLFPQKITGVDR